MSRMGRLRPRHWLALAIAAAALPLPAGAQPDETPTDQLGFDVGSPVDDDAARQRARSHFRMGVSFFREEDYEAALVEFKRAHALVPHYKVLFNIGQAFIELHQYAEAVDYLERYLHLGGARIDRDRRAEVEALIGNQRERIATLRIRVDEPGAQVEVDGEVMGSSPIERPVRLRPGEVRVRVSKLGFTTAEREVELAAGESRALQFELVRDSQKAPSGTESVPMPIWVAGASTVTLGAATLIMAVLTQSAESDLADERNRVTTQARLVARQDAVETRALLTDIGLGLTAVGAVVTSILLVNHLGGSEPDRDDDRDVGIDVAAGPGGAAVRLGGRF